MKTMYGILREKQIIAEMKKEFNVNLSDYDCVLDSYRERMIKWDNTSISSEDAKACLLLHSEDYNILMDYIINNQAFSKTIDVVNKITLSDNTVKIKGENVFAYDDIKAFITPDHETVRLAFLSNSNPHRLIIELLINLDNVLEEIK